MFPTELEITMQRRQYERDAANHRLAMQLRGNTSQPTLAQRISRRVNLRVSVGRTQAQSPCPEVSVKVRAI